MVTDSFHYLMMSGSGRISMKKIYVCNDTITGIFSAIYDAWKEGREEKECGIAIKGILEQELFCEYMLVEENLHKEQAVERLIRKHLGGQAYADIWHASLASDKDKADAIYGTMLAARRLRDSKKVMEHLSHPQVERVFELSRKVGSEAHNYKGFLRFQELSGGILYGGIAPKNRILTCIAPHFANRLPQENWLIHDKTHHMYAVHEAGKEWVLVENERIQEERLGQISENEQMYASLWTAFCRTISIESRENPRSQMQHLPLRYRPEMTEMAGEV